MQTTTDRLKAFVEWTKSKGLVRTDRDFEKLCGLSNGYLNSMLFAQNGNIRSDKIAGIAKTFPILNIRWLCTGEGCMVINSETRDEKITEAMKLLEEMGSVIRSMEER